MTNWLNQFGAEYDVPAAILNHPGIVDNSWGNDAAPSFTLTRYQADGDYPKAILWVEHPDAEKREMSGPRFTVCAGEETLIETDDISEALQTLAIALNPTNQ